MEKVHAGVAGSTFGSQNVKSIMFGPLFDDSIAIRRRKSARCCGAKHICKSKCAKHVRFGALLEVEMSKKCTPLWREAHFEVKMYETHHARTTFGRCDVEKVHAVVARSTFRSKKCQNTWCSDHFLTIRWPFDVEKVHAVVARSTFPSQNVKITTRSGHFWTVRRGKSARRCGAKHILMKNVKITACSGQFLTIRSCCDVEKLHAVVARSTCPSQKLVKLRVLSHFLKHKDDYSK